MNIKKITLILSVALIIVSLLLTKEKFEERREYNQYAKELKNCMEQMQMSVESDDVYQFHEASIRFQTLVNFAQNETFIEMGEYLYETSNDVAYKELLDAEKEALIGALRLFGEYMQENTGRSHAMATHTAERIVMILDHSGEAVCE
ncbi:MAG: hypothetical protein ACI4TK_08545 [Agathobacter sp.]